MNTQPNPIQPLNEARLSDGPELAMSPLRCVPAKQSYSEALAKERDGLRVKLNKARAQRDELLATLKVVTYELREFLAGGSRPNAGAYAAQQAETAIANAEKGAK